MSPAFAIVSSSALLPPGTARARAGAEGMRVVTINGRAVLLWEGTANRRVAVYDTKGRLRLDVCLGPGRPACPLSGLGPGMRAIVATVQGRELTRRILLIR